MVAKMWIRGSNSVFISICLIHKEMDVINSKKEECIWWIWMLEERKCVFRVGGFQAWGSCPMQRSEELDRLRSFRATYAKIAWTCKKVFSDLKKVGLSFG